MVSLANSECHLSSLVNFCPCRLVSPIKAVPALWIYFHYKGALLLWANISSPEAKAWSSSPPFKSYQTLPLAVLTKLGRSAEPVERETVRAAPPFTMLSCQHQTRRQTGRPELGCVGGVVENSQVTAARRGGRGCGGLTRPRHDRQSVPARSVGCGSVAARPARSALVN